jgi:hypothetical protein
MPELHLLLPEFLFRLLPVVDIDVASVPTENVSGAVKQGRDAFQEPSVFSVEPPEAGLYVEGFPFRQRRSPFDLYLLEFVGMICRRPTLAQRLFQRHSRVIQPALINKVDATVWSRTPV